MENKTPKAVADNSSQKEKSNSKTNPPRPIITPKEARKVLGSEYKNLSDEELYRVIIEMERLAMLLVENPELFNLSYGENKR